MRRAEPGTPLPADALWIDLHDPTADEEQLLMVISAVAPYVYFKRRGWL